MDFSKALKQAREHSAIVQRMEFALRSDPSDPKLTLGLGSAQRRAKKSQELLHSLATTKQIDLVRYRLVNGDDVYSVEAVADSTGSFQKSFTGAVDFLESGPKSKARFSRDIEEKSRLNFAYSFSGSLGLVFAIENDRNMFDESEMDSVVDVFSQFLDVSSEEDAVDASRQLGGALVSQLCKWVDANAKWESSVDFIVTQATEVQRGEFVPKNKFFDLHDIFHNAKDEQPHEFTLKGTLVGLDTDDRRFHFVVPGGDDYKGGFHEDFVATPTTVPARYTAIIGEKVSRVVATGKETRSYSLKSLTPQTN
jgi:hypothetical protein